MKAVGCLCALALVTGIPIGAGAQPKKITVIAMTDFHGALENAAILASYVRALREKNTGPVVLVDAGDEFQGTMVSNLNEGKPVVRFFNLLGLDASALGNHEFDFGPVGPSPVASNPGDDPQGALKARIREARFPILAANVVGADGKPPAWLKPSVLIERDGVKIGIVGAADEKTPESTMRDNLRGLTFLKADGPVAAEAEALRAKGAEVVVLLAHFGGGCKDNTNPDDLSTCDGEEIFPLVKRLRSGLVDVVVGGHTHKGIVKRINHTAILEPFSQGKDLAWAEVLLPVTEAPAVFGPVAVEAGGVFLGTEMRPDAATTRLLADDFKKVRKIYARPLNAVLTEDFTRAPRGESALGNLVTDLFRENLPDVDIGLTNNGGLRTNLPKGPLVYGRLYDVMPFDNRVAVLTVDGETLRKLVALGLTRSEGFSWSGLTFEAVNCDVQILVGSKPLDPAKIYRIATTDYLVTGGSGVARLRIPPENAKILDVVAREAVAKILKTQKPTLDPAKYYSAAERRQKTSGSCTVPPE